MTHESVPNPADQRVVVAMSGGVDSSVAAALLVEQGYEVVGMMMRLWAEPTVEKTSEVFQTSEVGTDIPKRTNSGAPAKPMSASAKPMSASANRCCTPDQMADARRVADRLGIPFYVLDVQDHFRATIVQFFIDEHVAGRTPNPCIECNRQIRFTYLMQRALALDADYLATGHYARIRRTADGYQLLKAADAAKDQSYVLHVLTQQHLARTLFPIGGFTKDEVRDQARRFGLPVASKQESQDLCFLGDGDYRRFLRDYEERVSRPGPILDREGHELGRHEGLAFYTIGQRKGLGLSSAEPLFVLGKDAARNALVVGPREALGQRWLSAERVTWIAGAPDGPVRAEVKIRYKAQPVAATVTPVGESGAQVVFDETVSGVTAGQGAVFYDGEVCLGGGLIASDERSTSISLPLLEGT